ncbi:MAG TPA: cytochrome c1 [Reyranella sp.]|nr:cytochrome c1 [Reyranella sp.]
MRKLIVTGALIAAALASGTAAFAQSENEPEPTAPLLHKSWGFQGPFGTYDRAAAQRGFQIYQTVCAACHSMNLMAYRNLMELGLSENQVKGIAAEVQVPDIGDDGSAIDRPARPSDHFRKPFANELAAAAANGGKAPPDLSVIVKAREGGPDYVYSLMQGYVPFDKLTPEQIKKASLTKDDNYNKYFAGHRIAMPPPLTPDKVQYVDNTKATLEQEASDVVEFLAFASEPHLEDRNRTGVRVVLFLLVLSGFMYAVKRAVWADKH